MCLLVALSLLVPGIVRLMGSPGTLISRAELLQIVMAGTLELRDRIMAKRNKALRSRIFARHAEPDE